MPPDLFSLQYSFSRNKEALNGCALHLEFTNTE